MTNQSELEQQIAKIVHRVKSDKFRPLAASVGTRYIMELITANYTANSEIAEREQSLWAITYDFLHGVDRGLCDEWERVIAERAKLKELK